MTSKLRLKLGAMELDCEGSEEFLTKELPAFLNTISEMLGKAQHLGGTTPLNESGGGGGGGGAATGQLESTTGAIAVKLSVKSGSDLVQAASAKLTLVDGKERFTRRELIDAMREASAHFKQTHVKNLTSSLATLIKDGVLLEPAKDTFALAATARESLRQRL